ncbi:hypothetical protein FRB90_001677 [Tulasnella sp. 427]|nr:hypothetical protein FRB90_001677 [Tulasnella sp. 427]
MYFSPFHFQSPEPLFAVQPDPTAEMLPPALQKVDEAIQILLSSIENENELAPIPTEPMGRAECDEMTSRIRLGLEAIQARAQTVLTGLIQTRNALTPINNLPAEIIVRIWTLAARDSAENGYDMLWALAQVCKWWRDKVLAYSELWGEGVSTRFSEHRIVWAIRKSGNRRLYVSVHDGAMNQHQDRFDQILAHADRWASLSLSLARNSDSVYTLRVLHLPNLTRLVVSRWGNRLFHDPVEPPGAPYLQVLHLTAVPFNWDVMLFPRLRIIQLEHITRMGPSLEQLFYIITSSPELEELILENIDFAASEDPMYNQEPETSSHPYFDVPNLHTLRLHVLETDEAAWILCSLRPSRYQLVMVDFLPTSVLHTHLQHLHFYLADTFSYGQGLTLEVLYQVISIHIPGMSGRSEESLVGAQGLNLQFGSLNPSEDLELASNFFVRRHIPLTIEILGVATQFQDHFESLQLHKLSSLQTLRIAYPIDPSSLLRILERPYGPRTNLWWPCPSLSTLEIGSHEYPPEPDLVYLDASYEEFVAFLQRRWGEPPQEEDFTLGPSRPAKLDLLVHKSLVIDRLTRLNNNLLGHAATAHRRFRMAKPIKHPEESDQEN